MLVIGKQISPFTRLHNPKMWCSLSVPPLSLDHGQNLLYLLTRSFVQLYMYRKGSTISQMAKPKQEGETCILQPLAILAVHMWMCTGGNLALFRCLCLCLSNPSILLLNDNFWFRRQTCCRERVSLLFFVLLSTT